MSFSVFLFGNLSFIGTILLVFFSFAVRFRKRENFRFRVLFSTVLLLPVFAVTFLHYFSFGRFGFTGNAFQIGSFLNFLLLFVLCALEGFLLYDEDFLYIFLTATAAYASQHLISNACSLIRAAFGLDVLLYDGHALLFTMIQLAVTAIAYGCLYLLFIRTANRNFVRSSYSRRNLLIAVMTLFVVLVLNLFRDMHSAESPAMNQICTLFASMCCVFILLLYSGIITQNRLEMEQETIQELWRRDKKQYELKRDSIEMINIKCHDLRKRLELMEESGYRDTEQMQSLRESIAIYDASLKTGNDVLDTLLMEYLIFCERHNIRFTVVADCAPLGFMDPEDIYSFFANLISNAIEGAHSVPEKEKRIISLVVREQAGVLSVKLENYFEGELRLRDGIPMTTKQDADSHGFGTKSIRLLTEKYNGTISYSAEDGIFTVQAIFPLD